MLPGFHKKHTQKRRRKKTRDRKGKDTLLLRICNTRCKHAHTQFPKNSLQTVCHNSGGKALVCNPGEHVRKSEFPGMLF